MGIYYELWGLGGVIFGKVVICGLGIFAIETGCRIDAAARKRKEIYYTAILIAFLLFYLAISIKENMYLLKHWMNI
ncbi:MAG: hypothetical protein NT136_02350 [Candidatus Moranbacteria bacterium]|nr:hypothetical protein [Candidatus Moranbacteria bacterium]